MGRPDNHKRWNSKEDGTIGRRLDEDEENMDKQNGHARLRDVLHTSRTWVRAAKADTD